MDEAEIRGVVEYVYHSGDGRKPAPSFLGPDANRIREVLDTVEPLFDGVTDTGLTAADVLPRLFRPDELVCTGPDTYTAQVRPTEKAAVDTGEQQFICCNPMRAIWAQTGTGKFSSRCQNNVLLRRYLVAEFDDIELTKQHQAQLATALAKGASLVMVVDSGHKSLHCWFYVEDLSPQDQIRFFTVACVLGADPSRFDSCAWLRMPGGLRINDGTRGRQRILFFSNARTYQKEGAE